MRISSWLSVCSRRPNRSSCMTLTLASLMSTLKFTSFLKWILAPWELHTRKWLSRKSMIQGRNHNIKKSNYKMHQTSMVTVMKARVEQLNRKISMKKNSFSQLSHLKRQSSMMSSLGQECFPWNTFQTSSIWVWTGVMRRRALPLWKSKQLNCRSRLRNLKDGEKSSLRTQRATSTKWMKDMTKTTSVSTRWRRMCASSSITSTIGALTRTSSSRIIAPRSATTGTLMKTYTPRLSFKPRICRLKWRTWAGDSISALNSWRIASTMALKNQINR